MFFYNFCYVLVYIHYFQIFVLIKFLNQIHVICRYIPSQYESHIIPILIKKKFFCRDGISIGRMHTGRHHFRHNRAIRESAQLNRDRNDMVPN